MTIKECLERVGKALDQLGRAEDYILGQAEFTEMLLDMERDRLFSGKRADGSDIEPPYTLFTQRMKSAKGQPTDAVTLFDTGAFHSSLFVRKEGGALLFGADDPKTGDLVEKYGEGIFGLTDENREAARKAAQKLLAEWFKNETGLK